jgi:SAM-dependent methyltransferase
MMPDRFINAKVYDFGSLNINGDNRQLFTDCDYLGIDLAPGPNVDVYSPAHLVELPGQADVVISGEMLEHDRYWQDSLLAFVRWSRPGGLVLVSCATEGRPEHGTSRRSPTDSPHTNDYYRNLVREDFETVWPNGKYFEQWVYTGHDVTKDLYFWGIRNAVDLSDLPTAA